MKLLNRRATLLGTCASILGLTLPADTSAQDSSLALYNIQVKINTIKTPGIGAFAGYGLTAFGAYQDAKFQEAVAESLGRIEQSLKEMHRKLDEILVLLRAIPEVVEKALDEHEYRKLRSEVVIVQQRIFQILSGKVLSSFDKQSLRDNVEENIKAVFRLLAWGPVGYGSAMTGYATLIGAFSRAGISSEDFLKQKSDIVNYLKRHTITLREQSKSAAKISQDSYAVLPYEAASRLYRLGEFIGADQSGTRDVYFYFARVRGNVATGFAYDNDVAHGSEFIMVHQKLPTVINPIQIWPAGWDAENFSVSKILAGGANSEATAKQQLYAYIEKLNELRDRYLDKKRIAEIAMDHSIACNAFEEIVALTPYLK